MRLSTKGRPGEKPGSIITGISTTTFHPSIQTVTSLEVLEKACESVRNLHAELDPNLDANDVVDIAVSFDGSWQTRGHGSNFGVGFVIDILSGLILDYHVCCKYCAQCELVGNKIDDDAEKKIWQEAHRDSCDINYTGSSGNMEAHIALVLWRRSIESRGFRYTEMIGDGDSSTIKTLNDNQVYGDGVDISKEECINHIHKRMFCGLDSLASTAKQKGVAYRGRNRMTADRMKRWSSYYRNALVKNSPDTEKMRDAVWAILFHSVSTMEDPHHSHCDDSWCWYKIAQKEGRPVEDVKKEKEIDPPLSREIGELLLPLFRRLSDIELLKRCTRNQTQNANESLHSVIWNRVPKAKFAGRKTVESGISLGVQQFNKGASATLDTLINLGISPGVVAAHSAQRIDTVRIKKSEREAQTLSKAARKARKCVNKRRSRVEQTETQNYKAGQF